MIRIVSARKSSSAEALAFLLRDAQEEGVVNWTGGKLPGALNGESQTNKLRQLVRLDLKKVPVPPYSETIPPASREGWLGRTAFHQQGRDLTRPPKKPDFWTKRLLLEDEWRLHFFKTSSGNYKLLRSAIKLPKEKGHHPWIKSHRLGWKLSYVGGAPITAIEVGRAALAALQLDFGAVDIGITSKGKALVLEVNTCPGLEGGTLTMYAARILERFGATRND